MTASAADLGRRKTATSVAALVTVMGVVYGDIGTSPLYALKASLRVFGGVPFSETEILGILSLFFWSLIMIVTVKYVTLIMRADNQGEGGILALMALSQRVSVNAGTRAALWVSSASSAPACSSATASSPRRFRSCRRSKGWRSRRRR